MRMMQQWYNCIPILFFDATFWVYCDGMELYNMQIDGPISSAKFRDPHGLEYWNQVWYIGQEKSVLTLRFRFHPENWNR